MAKKQDASTRWLPLKVLAVFTVAFLLQGMSLVIFGGAGPAGEPGQASQERALFGGPLFASKTFTVTTTADGGEGSLRQAIEDANENPGLDVIQFAFSQPVTVTLEFDLPQITDPVSMEAHGPWLTDTVPGWLTIDGSSLEESAAILDVSRAAGTSIRRLRLVNPSGYGLRIADGSEGSVVISNTVRNSAGGILLQNTGQITATHNVFLDLRAAAIAVEGGRGVWLQENTMRNSVGGILLRNTDQITVTHNVFLDLAAAAIIAEGSHDEGSRDLWMQGNRIRNVVEGDGIQLLGNVQRAIVITNSLSGIGGAGVLAEGDPAPTGVLIRGNIFTDTKTLIFLGPGANGGFPAPEILTAILGETLLFSARSPANPVTYTYPLSMDLYRVRDGNYNPLGVTVPYDGFPDAITYTVALTDVLATDQIALIATTANPSTSEFSPPVVFSPPTEDQDGDGVDDGADQCPGTVIPEATVPSVRLGTNRFALVDDDLVFDTTPPRGRGPGRSYTTEDTGGCSCEQIIAATGVGKGHVKFGCSIGLMDGWVADVSAASKQGADPDAARATEAPEAFSLEQNYPNPFNPVTTIAFQVPEQRRVRLRVFDVLGREVITLVDEETMAGIYQVQWDGRNAQGLPVSSGLYLYRMEAGVFSSEKTMILLR